jgi:hypothetical protein
MYRSTAVPIWVIAKMAIPAANQLSLIRTMSFRSG